MKRNTHLEKTEFIDFLDGTLIAERREHVDSCDACRRTAEELSLALASSEAGDVPEPSPLFWDQFSDRVRMAIKNEPPPHSAFRQFFAIPHLRIAAAAVAVVILMTVVVWRAGTPRPQPRSTDSAASADLAMTDDFDSDDGIDLDTDEAWTLVRVMAEDVAADDMSDEGMSGRPGSADSLALRLNERERQELARLLEEYVKRAARSESAS
jgi:hypothetical protein